MTVAKKATPSSLSDRLKDKDETAVVEENPQVDPKSDNNVTKDSDTDTTSATDKNLEFSDKPVTAQHVEQKRDVNPDGVSFSGRETVVNKTPGDLAAETPQETAERYGISTVVPDHVHNDPNINFTKDSGFVQIPGGTHLHPDIARDNYNRGVGGRPESANTIVNRQEHVYAGEAELDDKGLIKADGRIDDVQDANSNEFAGEAKNDDKGRDKREDNK